MNCLQDLRCRSSRTHRAHALLRLFSAGLLLVHIVAKIVSFKTLNKSNLIFLSVKQDFCHALDVFTP